MASPRRNWFTSALGQKIDSQEAQESGPKETDESMLGLKHEHGGDWAVLRLCWTFKGDCLI